ncbi:RNA 2',3'-cyclic phosphodiesterase [Aminivibrio sp.]|jgi:2'-5' RNA ligase|uniref:RNA 2',3'-cyclic phosphodiesterase n=1 Tax=Aminivibrio sp. TaxID=1872489 RepID=UPI001A4C8765|nr:RNA 2',3'-cyclic phosphodiesterase [Aminivibrio sp.]MBL3539686.1 RNA 2',3'-cyclic phosphodiesterase [Aminivibrio sp.]MDK2958556.1 2,3-cyclic 3-phosphodiesterase [Synergistaceae bacterium]
MSAPVVRSFVCIPLPEPVKSTLENMAAVISPNYPGLKWVGREQYHITLKFCGEHPVSVLEKFKKNAESAISGNRPGTIRLRLGLPGAFPGRDRARIFFVGIEDKGGNIERLAALIEKAAAEAGMEKENRPFHPHVTLARTRRPERLEFPDFTDEKHVEWDAETILWMKSELRPNGPEYSQLQEWRLR